MIKVRSEMDIFEVDGKKPEDYPPPKLVIESHWNCPNRVVVVLPDGKRFTVIVSDLDAAIRNATNSNRY